MQFFGNIWQLSISYAVITVIVVLELMLIAS